MAETRVYPRAPIELKVAYQRMNAFFADYTRDISKGGVFIKTENPLPIGTEFEFQISLPRTTSPLVLKGRVMWVDGEASKAPAVLALDSGTALVRAPTKGMGIKFVWDVDADRAGFEKAVEELMVETLGESLYKKLLDKGRS